MKRAAGQKEVKHRTRDGYIVAWDSTEDSDARRAVARHLRATEDQLMDRLARDLLAHEAAA